MNQFRTSPIPYCILKPINLVNKSDLRFDKWAKFVSYKRSWWTYNRYKIYLKNMTRSIRLNNTHTKNNAELHEKVNVLYTFG